MNQIPALVYKLVEQLRRDHALSTDECTVESSGSCAKGTALSGPDGSDVDIALVLNNSEKFTIKDWYDAVYGACKKLGYTPKRQRVSIGVKVSNMDVDIVPVVGFPDYAQTEKCWLYVNKGVGERLQTNIKKHIALIRDSGCLGAIRALKQWVKNNGLEFPSFYLELLVIGVLRPDYIERGPLSQFYSPISLDDSMRKVLHTLASDQIGEGMNRRVVDPANSSNVLSDLITDIEKQQIKSKAAATLRAMLSPAR